MPISPAVRSLRPSELARTAGISSDTIRYYERQGLLPKAARTSSGYRIYPAATAERLQVVRGALALGFTVEELRGIFRQHEGNQSPCHTVQRLGNEKLEQMDEWIADLKKLRTELATALKRWEKLLNETAPGQKARLLEDFARQQPERAKRTSPLVSPGLRRRFAKP